MTIQSKAWQTDGGLADWSQNVVGVVGDKPADFGVTADLFVRFKADTAAYAQTLETTLRPATRTTVSTEAKRLARDTLVASCRKFVAAIRASVVATDVQRKDLRISLATKPKPVPEPSVPPIIEVFNITGRTVQLVLKGSASDGGRRPRGVIGAMVYAYLGETPPQDMSLWKYTGTPSRGRCRAILPNNVPEGTKMWITARWTTRTGMAGPPADPVSGYVQLGTLIVPDQEMKNGFHGTRKAAQTGTPRAA